MCWEVATKLSVSSSRHHCENSLSHPRPAHVDSRVDVVSPVVWLVAGGGCAVPFPIVEIVVVSDGQVVCQLGGQRSGDEADGSGQQQVDARHS